MGDRKRQRTASHHLTHLDKLALGMAEDDIFDHNFRKLLASGVVVTEIPEKKSFLYRKLTGFVKRMHKCK